MTRWSFCNISGIAAGRTSRWYRYYGLRRGRDSHMERGRPGADYTAKTLRGHKGPVCDVVYVSSPDPTDVEGQCRSMVASCGVDGTVKTWDVREGSVLWESAKHGCPVRCLSSNLSHHFLVSSDDKGVSFVWNTETGQETSALTPGGQECPVLSTTVFSPSTKHGHPLILASHRDGFIRLWDTRSSAAPVHTLSATPSTNWLSFSHTASTLLATAAVQHSPIVKVWDLRCVSSPSDDEPPASLLCELSCPSRVSCASWLPRQNERLVVGCVSGELNICKVERPRNIGVNPTMLDPQSTTQGHARGVQCLGVSGNLVVSGGNDHMVRVWEVQSDRLVRKQEHADHGDIVSDVHVDGYRAVSCSSDYSIRAYRWSSLSDKRGTRLLESRYTLLGGSVRGNKEGFKKVLCDYSSCIGIAGETLKAYSFRS